ncbi:MAG: outer membrane lipoprotein-sorting protein [Magnetococcus sp. YQC-3]
MMIGKKTWRRVATVALSLFVLLLCAPVQEVLAAAAAPAVEGNGKEEDKQGKRRSSEGEKILSQVDRKLTPESGELFVQVSTPLPNGRTQQISLYVVKGKGKKTAALVLSPEHLLGRAILRLEDDLWMHVPGELELRSAFLNQSLLGGNLLNNADLLLTDFAVDYKATLLEENETSYLLELLPRNSRLPYARQLMRVDRKLLLPQTLTQYGTNGAVMKTITFDQLSDSFGFLRPGAMRASTGKGGGSGRLATGFDQIPHLSGRRLQQRVSAQDRYSF